MLPAGLFSQNWQLINPDNVYFYKTNGSTLINNTVLVNSVAQNTNDTVFYSNTLVDFYSDGVDDGLYLINLHYSKNSFMLVDTVSLVNISVNDDSDPNLFQICINHPEFLGARRTEVVKKNLCPGAWVDH